MPSRRKSGRRKRHSPRTAGHDAAVSAARSAQRPEPPNHELIPAGQPELIESDAALAGFLEHVQDVGLFAYDTEFIGEETYRPHICVVQLSTPDRIAVVDPLADVSMKPIWEAIAEPALQTIVHAGMQDLEPVVRHLGRAPANIFDTQIAAGFASMPYPTGLRTLVEHFADIRLGKGLTYTRWDDRPLSQVHIDYAADDVRYLCLVKTGVADRVEQAGLADELAEELALLSEPSAYDKGASTRLAKMAGNRRLKPREYAILRELVELREHLAEDADQPPRSVLRDDVLMRIVKERPKDVDALAALRNFPRPLAAHAGEMFLEAVERAREIPPEELPDLGSVPETPQEQFEIDAIWSAARARCYERGIDPTILGKRADAAALYTAFKSGETAIDSPLLQGWRGRIVGHFLLETLAGE